LIDGRIVVLALFASLVTLLLTAGSARTSPRPDDAGTWHENCAGGAPGVFFTSSAEIQVPAAAGSVIPPAIRVTCRGAAISNPRVLVTLAPGSAPAVFGDEDQTVPTGGITLAFTGNRQGQVILPIITSAGLADGSFTLKASWGGASAVLAGEVVGSPRGIVPPANPHSALGFPDERDAAACSDPRDTSIPCLITADALINAGRQSERLGPLILPVNWAHLSVSEQLFVLTDLERTARGLPPITGLAGDWDAVAQRGAAAGDDPRGEGSVSPYHTSSDPEDDSGGRPGYWSVEASGSINSLVAIYQWVYTDGIFADGTSGDTDCNVSSVHLCWGHRDAILNDSDLLSCQLRCAMGAGYSPTGDQRQAPTFTEIFAKRGGNNADPLIFTWPAERSFLPDCERNGDTCSWAGVGIIGPGGRLALAA
jgi:hypothetical protein